MNGAAGLCVVIVIALGVIAAVWTAAATAQKRAPTHSPQIYCDDDRQRYDGYGGWPLCELKLRDA
jgi:hypothetical protein